MLSSALILVLFPLLMAFAACSDLLTMTISNKLVVALTASFVALALMTGLAWPVIGSHLASGALVLVVAFGCYAAGWIGGGDAKLAAAIALWFGFDHMVIYLLYASLLGGLLTLLVLRFRSEPLPAALMRQAWVMRLHDQKAGVPYGIALAAAALVLYPDTIIMQQLTT
jgi:prepilin peptidase CpaA